FFRDSVLLYKEIILIYIAGNKHEL
mgnify:CR=1